MVEAIPTLRSDLHNSAHCVTANKPIAGFRVIKNPSAVATPFPPRPKKMENICPRRPQTSVKEAVVEYPWFIAFNASQAMIRPFVKSRAKTNNPVDFDCRNVLVAPGFFEP